MEKPIITLTTDSGTRDFYIPAVKGYILQLIPNANIVDITHQIKPFHLAEAAFILKNAFPSFPAGTIHLVSVESNQPANNAFLLVKNQRQYFFSRDNGLISLLFDTGDTPSSLVRFTEKDKKKMNFPLKNVLAEKAFELHKHRKPEKLGEKVDSMVSLTNLRPILMENTIRGTVIYIDNFGNAITNISPEHLAKYKDRGKPLLHYNRTDYIENISAGYDDVPEGEALCLFGNTGLLEISINKGKAGQLLDLHPGHIILMEFK